MALGGGERLFGAGCRAQVVDDGEGVSAVRADVFHRGVRRVGRGVRDHDPCAFGGEAQGDTPTDVAGAPGDQRRPPAQQAVSAGRAAVVPGLGIEGVVHEVLPFSL
ncbi:hypothetical protein SAZ11_59275 [Streptomyces sp. FXJ1.4098]|nr:hypothetical protein [Streptomyces sp. FXJ1.4098]